MKTSVVITGIGILNGYGVGKETLKRFLSEDPSQDSIDVFNFDSYIDTSLVRRSDYFSRCALVAAKLALEDAGLLNSIKENSDKVGVVLGTTHGALNYTVEYHTSLVLEDPRTVSPLLFSESVVNAAASHISKALGIRGYVTTISGYCAVMQALQLGYELIEGGIVDVCLVGGADVNHDFLTKAYSKCLSKSGLIKSNFGGSGFFIIESLRHAVGREAKIYAQAEGVSVITASYTIANRYRVSPLSELLNKVGAELKENDCLLFASYEEEDCLKRLGLYLQDFKHSQHNVFDCSNTFDYGFCASEAFQLILGALSVYSLDYLSSFKSLSNTNRLIDRTFVMRTALAGTNGCILFSRYPIG
jgi:3-oxoacyl-(acyl-carrier-protein) synthase